MQLRLKTKFTLTTSLLVLGVVALTSTLYVITLTHQVIRQAEDHAQQVAQKVFFQADRALADAVKEGAAPASESPADLREYVRQSLFQNVGLHKIGRASCRERGEVAELDGSVKEKSISIRLRNNNTGL